jgi:peptidoglycan/LPS O-acetylase OafA/YrhL
MKYRPDIDGLRAVAVLPVVLYHAGVPWFGGGFVGVDVFFVISGYLITRILHDEIRENRFSLAGFYERRVRRIFPALFTVLLVCTLVAARLMLPSGFEDYGRSVIAATLFVANLYFWNDSGYFAAGAETKPLLHTWSLSVEEQFYLVFPLVPAFITRFCRGEWRALLLPAAAVSFLLNLWATARFPDAAFYLTPMRGWELLIGAFVALGLVPPFTSRPGREIACSVGLGLVLGAVFFLTAQDPFPGLWALLPCIGAALIIHAGLDGSTMTGRLLSCRPLVFVGRISYSLYLWHWPIFVFARQMTAGALTGRQQAVVVVLSLLLAVLSWYFVEQPFRHKGVVASRRTLFQGAGAVLLFFTVVGGVISLGHGLPARFGRKLVSLHCDLGTYNLSTCFLKKDEPPSAWQGQRCLIGRDENPTAVLWGDSFAAHYVPGIEMIVDQRKTRILQYNAGGCAPVFDYDPASHPLCRGFNGQLPELLSRYRIRTVIMAAAWQMGLDNAMSLAAVRETVERLRALGLRVVIIGQSPRFRQSVQDIYNRSLVMGHPVEQAEISAHLKKINMQLRSIAGERDFFDPLALFCSGTSCRFRDEKGFFFWDDGHMTRQGSIMAAKQAFAQLDL